MSDWSGSGTTIPAAVPAPTDDCIEYLSIAALRAEYGDEIADRSDESLQRQIDQLVGYLEDQLGHTFGRGLIARSTIVESVEVTATALVIGGDSYAFVDYPTLQSLIAAVNAAGETYSLELLPTVRSDTPSSLLKLHAATACGSTYSNRVILCLSALFCLLTGKRESHLFLPLPLAEVVSVSENNIALALDDFYGLPGDLWLVRKSCGCLTTLCGHPKGLWSAQYPGNIAVTYVPQYWGRVPSTVTARLLDAFSSRGGLAPYESEDFGDYRYRRGQAKVASWQETLGGGDLRRYSTKFHP